MHRRRGYFAGGGFFDVRAGDACEVTGPMAWDLVEPMRVVLYGFGTCGFWISIRCLGDAIDWLLYSPAAAKDEAVAARQRGVSLRPRCSICSIFILDKLGKTMTPWDESLKPLM